MSGRTWTAEQEQAIYAKWINKEKTKRGNILVNAAAGSGKTAVLVERIIKKLIPEDGEKGCDVKNLLVVTFTNAAAGEMQERISEALEKSLSDAVLKGDYKKQKLLKRQISMISSADITTIDAFCLKTIRSYFHLLKIDPDFTIMDSGELELLKDDAMEKLFDEMYEKNDKDFMDLICLYTDGRDDRNLADKIKQIYNFIQAFPYPEEWLREKCENFKTPEESTWIKNGEKKAKEYAENALKYLFAAAEIIVETALGKTYENIEETMKKMPPHEENSIYLTWGTYYTAIYDEYFNMKKILTADWDQIYELSGINYIDLRTKADYTDKKMQIKDRAVKDTVKSLRDIAKEKMMRNGIKKHISMPLADIKDMISEKLYTIVSALVNMTVRFGEIYKEMKAERNVMEFSDAEHLCLKLFSEHEEVRTAFKKKYEEILMDEYQDSNRLQEEIFKTVSRGDNMFMVGDMKQSIYRFRSSDPEIFKEKSDIYKKDKSALNRKIILSKNFRSRREVLESINDIFEVIMSEAAGGTDYDEDQRLNTGDLTYENKNGDYRSECIVIEETGDEDDEVLDKYRLEARVIAAKINDMKRQGFFVRDVEKKEIADPESGEIRTVTQVVYRKIKNSDITILMSSYKGISDIYIDELSKAGIDCYAESVGYFERNEIKLVMALLKIIGNPYQDIPLLGILRSPIGGFSDDDLVNIRLCDDGYIYSAMKKLIKSYEAGEITDTETKDTVKKAMVFTEKLNRWREYVKYMTSDKLLWTLYEETDIYGFVGALYGGEEAQANLRLLFERAKKYEKTGYKGLFNFVRYISLLKKNSEDLSVASMVSENHDVVRMMTIHKSKGLEFPVVFLAGCAKEFNLRDTSGSILLHRDIGFGLDFIDFEKGLKITNITKTVTADMINRESISEEIRKLYVAMTRAKEKLIITAVAGGKRTKGGVEALEEKWKEEAFLSPSDVLEKRRFIDWIAPVAINNEEKWIYKRINYIDAIKGDFCEDEQDNDKYTPLVDISKFMSYEYPYKNSEEIPSKVSVSEIKKKAGAEELSQTQMMPLPEFMREKADIKGAKRGTLIHYIMQKIPFADVMDKEYVENFINKLVIEGKLLDEEAKAINCMDIVKFYESGLGMRIRKSKKVYRETAFEINIPADMIDDKYSKEETVILQGIIDCYFEEDGEMVLVDYKSDYYRNTDEMKKKYTTQIKLYADAIEKITEKKVKNKYLYLFFDNNVVEL